MNNRCLLAAILIALPITLHACGGAEDAADTGAATDMPAAESGMPATAADVEFLDPNTATRDELMSVPGVDQALADAIIAGRPYTDNVAVHHVVMASLTTEEQQDAFFSRVWIPLDLNSASQEEIMLIPGVGERMAHEFEEYRPYDGIERFRREIGKYVDEAEVARLEKYVTIR